MCSIVDIKKQVEFRCLLVFIILIWQHSGSRREAETIPVFKQGIFPVP